MTRRSLWLSVWPPPRQAVTKWSYLPLAGFAILFPAVCWVLEWTDTVVFTRLWPFVLMLLAPWFWRMHLGGFSGLSRLRAGVALGIRLGLLALFVVVLAEPRAVRTDERLSLIYVVDYSTSIVPSATDAALAFVLNTVASKPEVDEVGLMFFGRNAAVELPPGRTLPYENDNMVISVHIERDGTNVAKALSLAAAMLPPETQSRIVLISDGVATEGAIGGVLDDLKSRKIPVDVLPIDYQFDHEVWIERLDLPRFVKLGQPFDASVVLSSLAASEGTLTLEQNGDIIARQKVTFHAGKNRFTVPVNLVKSGYYEYSARIEVAEGQDSWKNNNQAISFLYLKGKGTILIVTGEGQDPKDWTDIERALREGKREVRQMTAFELPRAANALLPYDCILFVNVGRDSFDEPQLQAVHDAVYNQGTGFLMVGGPNSFGPGGYQQSVIEKVLPVTVDVTKRKIIPKGALAIILHTCEFADGNTWGKRITKQAIKVLGAKDEIGVLVYDYQGGYEWLFELVAAENYDALAVLINNARIGDMPDFGTTMNMGFDALKASDAAAKHMIIISDGDPSPPLPALLRKFRQAQIRVSTIAMAPHGPNCLPLLARATGGRYYEPKDPAQLPRIFIKEAKTLRRSAIQEKTFVPKWGEPTPILKGITGLPPLHGYVWTSPKARSVTLLDGPETEEPDPVLVQWRYGVGAAAAFTSDLSPRWGKDWISWAQYSAFVQQLVTEISRAAAQANVQVRSYAAGGTGHIVVEDFERDASFLSVAALVDGPRGSPQRVALKQVAPRRYEGKFPLQGKGRYQVTAVGVGGNDKNQVRAHGGFVVSYSDEFLRFRADPVGLDRIRDRTGGRRLTGTETGVELFDIDRTPRLSSRSIVDLLLLLLACLILLDVAFRRVQLDLAMLKSWLGLGGQQSTATLGSLLAMKERLGRADAERTDRPAPQVVSSRRDQSLPTTAPLTTSTPAGTGGKTPKTEATPKRAAGTTTSRLLEAKRRAQKKKP